MSNEKHKLLKAVELKLVQAGMLLRDALAASDEAETDGLSKHLEQVKLELDKTIKVIKQEIGEKKN